MTNLILSLWNCPEREQELRFCLEKNLENKFIDQVIILNDDADEIIGDFKFNNKLILVPFKGIPTYLNYFKQLNKLSNEKDINIVINSDIFFDETLEQVKQMPDGYCFALTRWEYFPGQQKKMVQNPGSQDAWIFMGRIKELPEYNIPLGKPGCDNSIAYRLGTSGYVMRNPCKSIFVYHYHVTDGRRYNRMDKVPGPYMLLQHCSINQPKCFDNSVFHPFYEKRNTKDIIMFQKHLTEFEGAVIKRLAEVFMDRFTCHSYSIPDNEKAKLITDSKICVVLSNPECIIPNIALEAMGCNTLVMMQAYYGYQKHFQDRIHVVVWTTIRQLVDTCVYYLEQEEHRKNIASQGRRYVANNLYEFAN